MKRYAVTGSLMGTGSVLAIEAPDGQWVKYEDVREYVKREDVLEEAAKVCDERAKTWDGDPPIHSVRERQWQRDEARYCAAAIRSCISKE